MLIVGCGPPTKSQRIDLENVSTTSIGVLGILKSNYEEKTS